MIPHSRKGPLGKILLEELNLPLEIQNVENFTAWYWPERKLIRHRSFWGIFKAFPKKSQQPPRHEAISGNNVAQRPLGGLRDSDARSDSHAREYAHVRRGGGLPPDGRRRRWDMGLSRGPG